MTAQSILNQGSYLGFFAVLWFVFPPSMRLSSFSGKLFVLIFRKTGCYLDWKRYTLEIC